MLAGNVDTGLTPLFKLIKRLSCHPIETSQLICKANQLSGIYMMATWAFNELIKMNLSMPFG